MSTNSNAANAGKTIKTGGFTARIFGYAFFYVPIALVWVWLMIMNKVQFFHLENPSFLLELVLVFVFILLPPAIPFILWEKSVRRFRRKHNLSIWKNVSAELEQMAIDEKVAKEHKAYANNGIAKESSGDKTDIGYWFSLLNKGAITQAEYEAKKKELL